MEITTKYLDYKVDGDARLVALSTERIRETETRIHRLRVYSDLETTDETTFKVNIALKRADGLTIGPLPMTLAQDDDGKWHRYIDIDGPLTDVVGPLELGISYNLWAVNEAGEVYLQKRYPVFTASQYVYDTNQAVHNELYDIYARLESVEAKADLVLEENTNIEISESEPIIKKKDNLWMKIINIWES